MNDFVAEFGNQSHYRPRPTPTADRDGFIARFGKPSKKAADISGYLSPPPETLSPRGSSAASPMCTQSPYSPYSCSSPSFTDMYHSSCDDYSQKQVLDMVSSKQLSIAQMRSLLENSILQLTETLLHGHSIDSIDGHLAISLKGEGSQIKVHLNKVYCETKGHNLDLELESSVRMKSFNREENDSPSSDSGDEWMGGLAPEMCLRSDARQSLSSPALYSPRTPSVDERSTRTNYDFDDLSVPKAGLTDSDVDVASTEKEKDFSQRLPAGKDTLNISGRRITCSDDPEDEPSLVIDIPDGNKGNDESRILEKQNTDQNDKTVLEKEVVMESETDESSIAPSSSSDDHEYSDESNNSEVKDRDTDGPAEAPGDSSSCSDPSVVSHSNSLVLQLSGGFKCKQCNELLTDTDCVVRHALENHNLYCCSFCHKPFTAKNNLKRHVRLHTGFRPYKCTQCSQKFARRDDLKGHMLRHDYNKPFRCSMCKKGYTDKACVKNHMAKEHGSRRLIVCPQCGESFDNEDTFSTHKTSHPELKKFSCHDCSFIGTNKLMTMKHKLIHTHKLFSCKPCNAYFPDPFNYTSHVRTHKTQHAFTSYTCCFCDLVLPSYEQFVRHEYSHAQGKIYSCPVCDKSFNSKSAVQEHSLCHEQEHTKTQTVFEANPNNPPESRKNEEVMDVPRNEMKQSVSKIPIPKIILSEPEVRSDDEICNGVLDLSMKKSSSSFPAASQLRSEVQSLSNEFSTSPRLCGPTEHSAPRNGCTSGPPASGMVTEISTQRLPLFSTVERTEENIYRPVFLTNQMACSRSSSPSSIPATIPQEAKRAMDNERDPMPQRPRSIELVGSNATFNKASMLVRSLSSQHRNQIHKRFGPYKRDKMQDLALKFLAARGPQSTLLKKGRPVFLEVSNHSDEELMRPRRSPLVQNWQIQERPTLSNIHMEDNRTKGSIGIDSVDTQRKEPEQFESSQLPTFIKSEPFFDTDSAPQGNCTVSKTFSSQSPDDRPPSSNDMISSMRAARHVCEQCKADFPSFPELENHSVNVHKRYLCEHCGKSFSARPNRDRHVRYHTGERPYACDLCDQSFYRGDDLKYHRTTRHPTAQPFVCQACSAPFTWKKDLERHLRQSKCKM